MRQPRMRAKRSWVEVSHDQGRTWHRFYVQVDDGPVLVEVSTDGQAWESLGPAGPGLEAERTFVPHAQFRVRQGERVRQCMGEGSMRQLYEQALDRRRSRTRRRFEDRARHAGCVDEQGEPCVRTSWDEAGA